VRFRLARGHLAAVYALGVAGAFLQIAGGTWDVASHIVNTPETFLTPQHSVLYAGIVLALGASGLGLLLRWGPMPKGSADRPLLGGLLVSGIGGGLQLVAGPFDLWWHETYGFDPHLLTPSHSLLIAGIVLTAFGMALGSVRLLEAHRRGAAPGGRFATPRALTALVVLALAALWMALNGLLYLLLDADGWAYTFRLGPAFVDAVQGPLFLAATALLAGPGTLVLLTATRLLPDRRTVAAIPLLVVGTGALGNVGFRAFILLGRGDPDGAALTAFLPLYLAFIVPILLFVLFLPEGPPRLLLLGAALVGPFVSFVDGFYSSVLWTSVAEDVPLVLGTAALVGLLAGLTRVRFARILSGPTLPAPAPTPARPSP